MEFRGVTEIACEVFSYARTMSTISSTWPMCELAYHQCSPGPADYFVERSSLTLLRLILVLVIQLPAHWRWCRRQCQSPPVQWITQWRSWILANHIRTTSKTPEPVRKLESHTHRPEAPTWAAVIEKSHLGQYTTVQHCPTLNKSCLQSRRLLHQTLNLIARQMSQNGPEFCRGKFGKYWTHAIQTNNTRSCISSANDDSLGPRHSTGLTTQGSHRQWRYRDNAIMINNSS